MSEKQRAEFEKWAKDDGFQLDVDKYDLYKSLCTWAAWKAWQAAIASVVVELPLHTKFSSTYYYKLAMKESIEKAEVKHNEQ